jgi:hypothetical protein
VPVLAPAELPYAAEDVLGKLQKDLRPAIVEEVKVDCVYLEHAHCKVKQLSSADTQLMLRNKRVWPLEY